MANLNFNSQDGVYVGETHNANGACLTLSNQQVQNVAVAQLGADKVIRPIAISAFDAAALGLTSAVDANGKLPIAVS